MNGKPVPGAGPHRRYAEVGETVSFTRRLVLLVVIAVLLFAGLPGLEMMRAGALAAAPPTITGLSVHNGTTAGGTAVIITGTSFTGAATVTFGGTAATTFTVDSDTQITATTAAHDDGSGRVEVVTANGSNADTTADDWAYTTRYEASTVLNSGFLYSPASAWGSWVASGASGGTYMRSQTSGSHMTVTFTGTYLAWIAVAGPLYGTASVQVDSGSPQTIDLYRTSTSWQQNVWNTGTLASGTHTVRIAWAATGTQSVNIDAIDITGRMGGGTKPTITSLSPTSGPATGGTSVVITGTGFVGVSGAFNVTFGGTNASSYVVNSSTQITAVAPSHPGGTAQVQVTGAGGTSDLTAAADFTFVTRWDQTYPDIVKTGIWSDYPSTSAYDGSYGRSRTSEASATVWFSGTKIAWIGMKGGTPGIVEVYLDDAKKVTLDLYASPAQYQVPLWTSDNLPDGRHHMDLVRGAVSLSTEYIVLDAVDIWGTIEPAPSSITSLSPSFGSPLGGTPVTINGTSFTGATSVTFDGTPATFTVDSATKITATAPAHAVGSVSVEVTTPSGSATSSFTYVTAPATTRTDVVKTTTVTTPGTTWSGTWASYASTSAFGAAYMRSSTAGAYVIIAFKGTRLDWITMKGTTGAIADIYVDGSATKATTINLYASPASYQQNLWSTGPLPDGYHTVKIVRSTASATGRYLTIDAIDIAGMLVPTTRIEENTPTAQSFFLWNPAFASWSTGASASLSGATYKYINTAGASVTINFTGPRIAFIAKTGNNYGNVTVTLDGVAKTVSLYSSALTYRRMVYTSGFITPGNHTLIITRAGTKSSSSSGYTINIDAIDLIGELRL